MKTKETQQLLEEDLKREARNGDFISNLLCPKCKKTITDLDLKHWKCIKCGAEFKVSFEDIKNDVKKKKSKDKVYLWVANQTGKFKLKWKTE